uniref:uncharacterized protein LOC118552983 n=1 Tax=Halichoerus grypus TaxID=9711 RepID=UPI001659E696|nr:uncharacterized protein LOC118552983 [Halichoerus grypus]XP_035975709.1 uncharacterized protein LOC118552983 [Halichoerus grypus]
MGTTGVSPKMREAREEDRSHRPTLVSAGESRPGLVPSWRLSVSASREACPHPELINHSALSRDPWEFQEPPSASCLPPGIDALQEATSQGWSTPHRQVIQQPCSCQPERDLGRRPGNLLLPTGFLPATRPTAAAEWCPPWAASWTLATHARWRSAQHAASFPPQRRTVTKDTGLGVTDTWVLEGLSSAVDRAVAWRRCPQCGHGPCLAHGTCSIKSAPTTNADEDKSCRATGCDPGHRRPEDTGRWRGYGGRVVGTWQWSLSTEAPMGTNRPVAGSGPRAAGRRLAVAGSDRPLGCSGEGLSKGGRPRLPSTQQQVTRHPQSQ